MKVKPDLPKYCFARGNRIWVRLKDEANNWKNKPTPYDMEQFERDPVGTSEHLLRLIKGALRVIEHKRQNGDVERDFTVRAYAERWVKERELRGIACAKQERSRLEDYIYPHIGELRLDVVRPRHVRDLVRKLKSLPGKNPGEKLLAPRTVTHIYNMLHNVYESAVIDELVAGNPVKLEPHERPKKMDKDPEWRSQATYTTKEVERLISDPVIPVERRVLYALKALAGLRHGEAAALCWRHLDYNHEPLARITVAQAWSTTHKVLKGTKNEQTRYVPLHPTLARILEAWKPHWERIYGRQPTPDDFIVPTRTFRCIDGGDACKAMARDLVALGLRTEAGKFRERQGHDLRSWYETQTVVDDADSMIIRRTTHAPPKDVVSNYIRLPWATICREVVKLKVDAGEEPLKVVTESLQLEKRAGARWTSVVTPKGLEAVPGALPGEQPISKFASLCGLPRTHANPLERTVTSVTTKHRRLVTELEHALRDTDIPRAQLLVNRLRSLAQRMKEAIPVVESRTSRKPSR